MRVFAMSFERAATKFRLVVSGGNCPNTAPCVNSMGATPADLIVVRQKATRPDFGTIYKYTKCWKIQWAMVKAAARGYPYRDG